MKMRKVQRAFTLLELLVVVAIIATLAAILFPVFAQAREKARQTTCLSNLKQLGSGILMYAQDFEETLPGATEGVSGEHKEGGWLYFSRFGQQGSGTFIPERGSLFPYLKNGAILHCPSDSARLSYAINGCLTQRPTSTGLSAGRSLASFDAPAGRLLLGEEGTSQGSTNDGFLHPDWDSFALRHQGRANVLYLDGHVKGDGTMMRWLPLLGGEERTCW